MPHKDQEARRACNAARMQRRRAEGTAWIDPEKEAERKARWYHEQGGKGKIVEANRQRRQRTREQGLKDFTKKIMNHEK